jgi:hypothetical protein
LTNAAGNPSATSAKTTATMTYVTFELLRDNPPPSAARVMEVPDINVLLYNDRTRVVDVTTGAQPTGSRGYGTRSSS